MARRGRGARGPAGSLGRAGARVTAWLGDHPLTLTYDGRPDAAHNRRETTGLAVADADGDGRALPDGTTRWYAEMIRPDGAHDLVTVLA
ncbi:hypothetical protein ACF3NS_04450 [Arsenicicoccus cauae]|uniref:hypothetical protein n=1 Tax=Arsenicicoccus cauae TaxID=2663847 RepID=UPI001E413AC6|nr:hypothetical protein [Arsenicicoccus cauae]